MMPQKSGDISAMMLSFYFDGQARESEDQFGRTGRQAEWMALSRTALGLSETAYLAATLATRSLLDLAGGKQAHDQELPEGYKGRRSDEKTQALDALYDISRAEAAHHKTSGVRKIHRA